MGLIDQYKILTGDCVEQMQTLPDASVHTCVTSPPYFGLRDYGVAEQIGLEDTPQKYVESLVNVFREVRRTLRDDGTVWLNLGDSYAADRGGTCMPAETLAGGEHGRGEATEYADPKRGRVRHKQKQAHRDAPSIGLKHKDLIGIPWRVAFALQAAGWYLRQDIIWAKPNPMPESVRDRCTKSHEYIFLLSKSPKYYFDIDAIKEPAICGFNGSKFTEGKTAVHQGNRASQKPRKQDQVGKRTYTGFNDRYAESGLIEMRQKRDVWTVTTKPFKGAHFATFPPDLIEPCILAGAPVGGTVLDPFGGSGTTAVVALKNSRKAILCELNPEYVKMAEKRIAEIEWLY